MSDDDYAGREEQHITSLEELGEKLSKLWDMVTGGDKPEPKGKPAEEEDGSVKATVRAELAKLRQAEDAAKSQEDRDREHAELKAKVEAIPERRPREYRKPTNFMGWATERDR